MKNATLFHRYLFATLLLALSLPVFGQDRGRTRVTPSTRMPTSGIKLGHISIGPPAGYYTYNYVVRGGVMETGTSWDEKSGLALDVASSCVIGTTNELYAYTNGNWTQMSDGLNAKRIAWDRAMRFYGITTDGDLFQFDNGVVTALPGIKATDVAVGKAGKVWITADDAEQGIYYSTDQGVSFNKVPGGAVRIDASEDGGVWVVNQAGDIFHSLDRDEIYWNKYPGVVARDIGVGFGEENVWVTATNGEIYYLDGCSGLPCGRTNRWQKIDGLAREVSVSGNTVWVINESNKIFERQE